MEFPSERGEDVAMSLASSYCRYAAVERKNFAGKAQAKPTATVDHAGTPGGEVKQLRGSTHVASFIR
jgi:hypothetical protein